MRSASFQHPAYLNRASLRSRATALFLSLAVSILIVVMLLGLGTLPPRVIEPESKPLVIQLMAEAGAAPKPAQAAAKIKRVRSPIPPPPLPPPPIPPLNMMILSREEFAAADISKLSSRTADAAGDAGSGSGAAEGQGEGPDGKPLYNAEWYREPTHAELATYLPTGNTNADWGMIVCRTVEKYRVDDCRELAESPSGSGLARALRQAAWQFLVRPPRIGGKPMTGTWVRIRFDFTHDTPK